MKIFWCSQSLCLSRDICRKGDLSRCTRLKVKKIRGRVTTSLPPGTPSCTLNHGPPRCKADTPTDPMHQ